MCASVYHHKFNCIKIVVVVGFILYSSAQPLILMLSQYGKYFFSVSFSVYKSDNRFELKSDQSNILSTTDSSYHRAIKIYCLNILIQFILTNIPAINRVSSS